MSPAKVFSAELEGIEAKIIEVEVDLHVGLHSFNIVGLADKALSEAKDRVNSALKNSGVKPPNKENRKITVNLAPADIRKTGSHYDMAIAIGYMLATQQIKSFDTNRAIFLGELALDGSLRPGVGSLNIAEAAAKKNFEYVVLPEKNAAEASAISGIKIIAVSTLKQTIDYLEGRLKLSPFIYAEEKSEEDATPDFASVKGQENAKRALSIAAAGGHNLLMVGSPGAGKSFMAQIVVSILPNLAIKEAIEITKILSAAGLSRGGLVKARPFRAPHHSASTIALVGGGTDPKPGEISLAHRGVLFLDELPEFRRDILEALRQPLENGEVSIARAKKSLVFPSKFTLLAAMNPCPCGYFGDTEKECRCTANEVFRYQKKISGPLLDRIDIQINIPRLGADELRAPKTSARESPEIKSRVVAARKKQLERFHNLKAPIFTNAEMSSEQCENFIKLDGAADEFLRKALETTLLSARGYYRTLKVAQTIADLGNSPIIKKEHLAEAFGYRVRQKE